MSRQLTRSSFFSRPLARLASFRFRPGAHRRASALLALTALLGGQSATAWGACGGDLTGDKVVDGADLGALLGAWGDDGGPADLNGNGTVDGADLGALLGSWGPCPDPCDGSFVDLDYAGQVIDLAPQGIPEAVVLDGSILFDEVGPDGMMFAGFPDGSDAVIELHPFVHLITTGPDVIDFAPAAPAPIIALNGEPIPLDLALAEFAVDLGSGAPPSAWLPTSRALLAWTALTSTPEWACNVSAATAFDGGLASGQPSWWCKGVVIGFAAAVVALAATGCAALTAGCAAGSTVTIGGLAVPCAALIGLCAGGTFAGGQAAMQLGYSLWGGS